MSAALDIFDHVKDKGICAVEAKERRFFAAAMISGALAMIGSNIDELEKIYADDPWAWISTQVQTFNSKAHADGRDGRPLILGADGMPIRDKRFGLWPGMLRECHRHIITAVHESNKVVIAKCRQLWISWLLLGAYANWHAQYTGDAAWVLCQSQKAEDAAEMVAVRAWAVYHYQMPEIQEIHPLRNVKQPSPKAQSTEMWFKALEHDPGARITSKAGGAHQWRGPTPTLGLSDESSVQADIGAVWMTADAALQDGGKHVLIYTPNGRYEFSARIAHDDPDTIPDDVDVEPPIEEEPCRGLKIVNNSNKVTVCWLHRYAFPERDETRTEEGKVWFAKNRPGKTIYQWRQEQELDHNVMAGLPAVPDFDRELHSRATLELDPRLPAILGVDYGYNRPAAVLLQVRHGQIWTIQEWMWEGVSIGVFRDSLLYALGRRLSKRLDPDVIAGLPSGWNMKKLGTGKEIESFRLQRIAKWANAGRLNHHVSFANIKVFEHTGDLHTIDDPGHGGQHNDKSDYTSRHIMAAGGLPASGGEVSTRRRVKLAEELALTDPELGISRFMVSRKGCPILYAGLEGGWHYKEGEDGKAPDSLPFKDGYHDHIADAWTYALSKMAFPWREGSDHRQAPQNSPADIRDRRKKGLA